MMIAAVDWSEEFAQALISFGFVALLGGAAGLMWGAVKQQHESDLKAIERFRDLYGQWFATWKGWEEARDKEHSGLGDPTRTELLARATDVEGEFEVLTVKITTERHLTDLQLRHLGRFREGYQQLRECIENIERLPFRVQYVEEEVKAYVAFKALSVEFARLLRGRGSTWLRPKSWRRPSLVEAQEAMVKVTSWRATGNRKTSWYSDEGARSPNNAIEQFEALNL